MASSRQDGIGGKQPPDKSSTKYYKCHIMPLVATVICIVCGGAYHKRILKD